MGSEMCIRDRRIASATAPASMMAPSTIESGGTGSLPNAATRNPFPDGFSSTALTALDPMSSPTTALVLRNIHWSSASVFCPACPLHSPSPTSGDRSPETGGGPRFKIATAVPSAQPTDPPDFRRNRRRDAEGSAVMFVARVTKACATHISVEHRVPGLRRTPSLSAFLEAAIPRSRWIIGSMNGLRAEPGNFKRGEFRE